MPFEISFITWLQAPFVASVSLGLGAVFAARGLIFFEAVVILFAWWSRKEKLRHAVIEALWASGIAILVTTIIASFVGRARPFFASSAVHLLIPPPWNTSFPSGHTAVAFAMAFAAWQADRRLGAFAFACAALVAIGRIAVGVHYPTDILGGFLVGFASFAVVRIVHFGLRRRDISWSAAHHHHSR